MCQKMMSHRQQSHQLKPPRILNMLILTWLLPHPHLHLPLLPLPLQNQARQHHLLPQVLTLAFQLYSQQPLMLVQSSSIFHFISFDISCWSILHSTSYDVYIHIPRVTRALTRETESDRSIDWLTSSKETRIGMHRKLGSSSLEHSLERERPFQNGSRFQRDQMRRLLCIGN